MKNIIIYGPTAIGKSEIAVSLAKKYDCGIRLLSAYPVKEIINTDLGKVMDKIFKKDALKNGKGGIAFLTNDVITRYDLTREAFIMALTEFINGEIWKD